MDGSAAERMVMRWDSSLASGGTDELMLFNGSRDRLLPGGPVLRRRRRPLSPWSGACAEADRFVRAADHILSRTRSFFVLHVRPKHTHTSLHGGISLEIILNGADVSKAIVDFIASKHIDKLVSMGKKVIEVDHLHVESKKKKIQNGVHCACYLGQ